MTPDIQSTINRLKELYRFATPSPWSIELADQDSPVEIVHHTVNLKGEKDVLSVFTPAYGLEHFDMAKKEDGVNPDVRYAVSAVNAMPALIAGHETTARKLAIYEKRMAYLAKNHPAVYAEVLKQALEEQGV